MDNTAVPYEDNDDSDDSYDSCSDIDLHELTELSNNGTVNLRYVSSIAENLMQLLLMLVPDMRKFGIPLPHPRTIQRRRPGYSTDNGTYRGILVSALKIGDNKSKAVLKDSLSVKVMAAFYGKDGNRLKPGLEFDGNKMELVGSKEVIDNIYLEENPENGSDVFDHVVENIRCRQVCLHCLTMQDKKTSKVLVQPEAVQICKSICENCVTSKKYMYQTVKKKQESCRVEENADPNLQRLSVIPDAFHNAKSLKVAFANWWLFHSGSRINLCLLRTLRQDYYSDIGASLRKVSTLEAFRHRDRPSTNSVAYVASKAVSECLHHVKFERGDHIVYTLIPDKFRKTDDNQKGTLIVPTDVIADPAVASLLYLTDAKKKGVYQVKLICPAAISQVKCNAESPVALEFASNCLVVADTSSKKVLVVDLKRQLEITALNLEKLKKGKLQDFADTNIYAAGPQPSKKTKAALICNIKEFLKNTDHKANKLNILNDEIGLPTVLATFQDDILYVADVQKKMIHELRVENKGYCLIATGRCVYSYCNTEVVFSLAISSNGKLFIADTSEQGSLLSVDLETGIKETVFKNGSNACTRIYGLTHMEERRIVFTDIGERKIKGYNAASHTVEKMLGTGKCKSVDRHSGVSSLEKPMAITGQGKSLFFIDANCLRILTGVEPVIQYCQILTKSFFNVNSQCQGPQGTPSQKSVNSISKLLRGLQKLENDVAKHNPDLKSVVKMKALTTLTNKYFNGVLRDFNLTPTVLGVSRNFDDACEDTLYSLVWAGFPYYTRETRGYQLPSSEDMSYTELVAVKQEKRKVYDPKTEANLLRYRSDFGQGIRQQNTRTFTTKDKP
eukprot:gene16353-17997_t